MSLLTEQNVKEFRQMGFTKIDHFWTDSELAAIKAALQDLVEAGKLSNVATEGDGVTHTRVDRNLQLCPLMPEHPLFDCLPYAEKVSQSSPYILYA